MSIQWFRSADEVGPGNYSYEVGLHGIDPESMEWIEGALRVAIGDDWSQTSDVSTKFRSAKLMPRSGKPGDYVFYGTVLTSPFVNHNRNKEEVRLTVEDFVKYAIEPESFEWMNLDAE